MVLLDVLGIMHHRVWLEEKADFLCMQSYLFAGISTGWWAQTRELVKAQARLVD